MDLGGILRAVLVLGGVCLVFGTCIAVAHARFRVHEDPRIDAVTDMLPGSNCGACGFAGCRAFAEGLVAGRAQPATCTQTTPETTQAVAAYLGVAAGESVRRVARLLCAGGADVAVQRARYRGLATCSAAATVAAGGKGCTWGCIGLGDCARACDYDAIAMDRNQLPHVTLERCTACGDCVEACPKDLFTILPVDHRLLVQCRSLLQGEAAEAVCAVACNGCGRCALDAPQGVVAMVDGLAVVDRAQVHRAVPAATARCPTGAIRWVEGEQTPTASTRPQAVGPQAVARQAVAS